MQPSQRYTARGMPEGDTIFRLAETLRPVLVGFPLEAARSHVEAIRERHLAGHVVRAIETRGKNLLMHFEHGLTLHTHLRMTGAWQVYERGERWRLPLFRLRVALMTAAHEVACFNAPVVRLLRTDRVDADPDLASLGPDLLAEAFDGDEALRRLRTIEDQTIGEALLDQRALAGIGNVLKSEVLFSCGVDPGTLVSTLDDHSLSAIIACAREVMLTTVTKGRSRTFALPGRVTRVTLASSVGRGEALWVYERAGKPCLRCHTTVVLTRQGRDARVTYHCPRCQPKLGYPPPHGLAGS